MLSRNLKKSFQRNSGVVLSQSYNKKTPNGASSSKSDSESHSELDELPG